MRELCIRLLWNVVEIPSFSLEISSFFRKINSYIVKCKTEQKKKNLQLGERIVPGG